MLRALDTEMGGQNLFLFESFHNRSKVVSGILLVNWLELQQWCQHRSTDRSRQVL